MLIYHDSRDEYYRAPGGAVTCGSAVRLRLKISGIIPDEIYVRTWDGGECKRPMRMFERLNDGIAYQADITAPGASKLLWYVFHIRACGQWLCYGNAPDHLGGVGHTYMDMDAPSYQITVYDKDYAPPKWLSSGAMYQVFVDRFFNGDPSHKLMHMRNDVMLHEDWAESPSLLYDIKNCDFAARDFFGGNLPGLRKKLPYLRDLGITALYLSPIFEAPSNHKYDTADYMRIDPMFGTDADFGALCNDAKNLSIRIILDGVFSHSGADSRYFNRYGHYDALGAYQSPSSKYYSWYTFEDFPTKYRCWWSFKTLPELNKSDPSYRDFFLNNDDAVVKTWIKKGAGGWRLDVADELPMDMLRELRVNVKKTDPDAAILGEVWEDASSKIAYGQLRSYCLGDTLDSAMNYPLRDAALSFMIGGIDAYAFARRLESQRENYAPPFYYAQMNLLSSHDRMRALNVLAGMPPQENSITDRDDSPVPEAKLSLAKRRLAAIWRFICALPGMPCVFYGDEVGQTGGADPLCRKAYPWGNEDKQLLAEFTDSINMRGRHPALTIGACRVYAHNADVAYVVRRLDGAIAVCALNRGESDAQLGTPAGDIALPAVSAAAIFYG